MTYASTRTRNTQVQKGVLGHVRRKGVERHFLKKKKTQHKYSILSYLKNQGTFFFNRGLSFICTHEQCESSHMKSCTQKMDHKSG